jgi:hypothetical protein
MKQEIILKSCLEAIPPCDILEILAHKKQDDAWHNSRLKSVIAYKLHQAGTRKIEISKLLNQTWNATASQIRNAPKLKNHPRYKHHFKP